MKSGQFARNVDEVMILGFTMEIEYYRTAESELRI